MTESWEKWQTTVEIAKQTRIEHERKVEESTKVCSPIRDIKFLVTTISILMFILNLVLLHKFSIYYVFKMRYRLKVYSTIRIISLQEKEKKNENI